MRFAENKDWVNKTDLFPKKVETNKKMGNSFTFG